jgi:hypothetical protein
MSSSEWSNLRHQQHSLPSLGHFCYCRFRWRVQFLGQRQQTASEIFPTMQRSYFLLQFQHRGIYLCLCC